MLQFLRGLEVKSLIIPSSPETVEMWKRKYNFDVVNTRELKGTIASSNLLMLPRAIRLYKELSSTMLFGTILRPQSQVLDLNV